MKKNRGFQEACKGSENYLYWILVSLLATCDLQLVTCDYLWYCIATQPKKLYNNA